jgi:beta-glucosidase
VAVVVIGTSEDVESEGFDRTTLALPGRQDELVRAVAAVNPRTVVVVNAGSPVELPWRDDVSAVLVSWFPGMEFGNALADVLLGDVEPGGRLPTTWPAAMTDAPVIDVTPTDGRLEYTEGLDIGHRAYLASRTEPAYWVGHGLGYTSWDVLALDAPTEVTGNGFEVSVRLRNTGSRRGKQVVQVYASRPASAVARPQRWLAGFAVVTAGPGEVVDVPVGIHARTLRHWDGGGWAVEPGDLTLSVGASAGDLRARASVTLASR